jgi:hypothetical protein
MMGKRYTVRSDRAQVVTGLGVFDEDEEQQFDERDAEGFKRITGLELAEGNVPEGVTVSVSGDVEEVDESVVPAEEQEIVEAMKADESTGTTKRAGKKGGTSA